MCMTYFSAISNQVNCREELPITALKRGMEAVYSSHLHKALSTKDHPQYQVKFQMH